jgi:integral membrane protein
MSALRHLRLIGLLEGLSFLALLFIAMPLKYLLGLPIAVRVAGSVHGLLFLLFAAALFRVALERDWPARRSLAAFGASLVPWGTFVLDRQHQRELELARSETGAGLL